MAAITEMGWGKSVFVSACLTCGHSVTPRPRASAQDRMNLLRLAKPSPITTILKPLTATAGCADRQEVHRAVRRGVDQEDMVLWSLSAACAYTV